MYSKDDDRDLSGLFSQDYESPVFLGADGGGESGEGSDEGGI